ncbi:TetR/AcrR family transcriptional regulator [Cereibacter sphaeroides]|uniref:TetR/AcrR family transcriptional regulator n=1 Tax=Rhodobacterales TaxID=204455 RepID=UPI000BBEB4D6|nr:MULTISPECIES: TetR/AcrR family transcriptional regulator [Paracoccaceae]MCE6951026.1 TetR/AcrR family transcriptional regulator [Cereibacter sphaeroides]MCE6960556.1 TetR/AcrR family transcriptional regulator [Cereibacter sphaeroides]MCE6969506.1 TetR/AcrR family transcriptional regulator [Cereibacter sphaeroides]MCE6972763.1 TetR/AcrR family transcriptional regulator [Cereibacter sphaeroides]
MARKAGSHAETTGPRVREAAQRLIARHGYAAVSMRQIAAEVGMQAGALYLYTPDKQTLLYDLMRLHMEELLAAVEALPVADDPRAALDQFARFHICYHIDRPEAVFIAYMELRNLTPANFAAVEALRRRYEQRLATILSEGERQGCFSLPEPRLATRAIIAMLTGVTHWFRDLGPLSRDEVAACYAQMALKAAGAGG